MMVVSGTVSPNLTHVDLNRGFFPKDQGGYTGDAIPLGGGGGMDDSGSPTLGNERDRAEREREREREYYGDREERYHIEVCWNMVESH
jgi:hypothetical protein